MIEDVSNALATVFEGCKITKLWSHGFRAYASNDTDLSAEFEFTESDVRMCTYVFHVQSMALWLISEDVVEYSDPGLLTVVRRVHKFIHTPLPK